nr:FtsX-like permease family protein [Xanthomonadales bacterium]
DFQRSDAPGTPKVAIVNRRFVERYGLGTNPVGKRIAFGDQAELDIEIVGLVGDSKYSDLRGETPPQFFLPRRQDRALGSMRFYLRTAAAPEAILGAAKAAVARHDASLPLEELRTMPQQIDVLLSADRFVGKLALAFAALATALAALGLYGVLNYMLAQRTREIGLRLALGAAPRRLRRMVLGQVGRMTLVGGTLGLLAALGVGRAASTVLYGLEGHDPTVLAAACGVLAVVALLASWLPVRRVGRIDPMAALRHD